MSDTQAAAVSKLLTQILSISSPELGARLKQRLKQAFSSSGLGEFDEKSLGFAKFTDYLQHLHGDTIKIVRQDGSGDVLVFLRSVPDFSPAPVLRGEVWQAFVNPDPNRKRFFHKETGRVVHYLDGGESKEQAEVESDPDHYVEIKPISADQQSSWMKEFIYQSPLSMEDRDALELIAEQPYSGSLNTRFIKYLGKSGSAWRNFKTDRVREKLDQWVEDESVDRSLLFTATSSHGVNAGSGSIQSGARNEQVGCEEAITSHLGNSALTPKQQVIKLMELLTDDDVSSLVLPTVLSCILIKSRM